MMNTKKRKIDDSIKTLIINKYNEGEKLKNISKYLSINYNTVRTIVRRFKISWIAIF